MTYQEVKTELEKLFLFSIQGDRKKNVKKMSKCQKKAFHVIKCSN